jgi:hypothetical protein
MQLFLPDNQLSWIIADEKVLEDPQMSSATRITTSAVLRNGARLL